MNRLTPVVWACAFTVFGSAYADDKPVYSSKAMSPEALAAQMGQSKHYDFELSSPDGFVDPQGMHVKTNDESAYLKEKGLDKSAYFFLFITSASPPLDTVAPVVAPLGNYGFTNIIFKHKPGGVPTPIVSEYHASSVSSTDGKAINFITLRPDGRSIVAGDPFPDLSGRPAALRPGVLPTRVRYAFASDKAVEEAANLVSDHLLSDHAPASVLFSARFNVESGAWAELKIQFSVGEKVRILASMIPLSPGKTVRIEGAVLSNPDDISKLETILRATIARSGGGDIRAASTEEMAEWWPFVPFDYVEPLLMLETKDHEHWACLAKVDTN